MGPHDAVAELDLFADGVVKASVAQLDDAADGLVTLDIGQGALDGQVAVLLVDVGAADARHLDLDQDGARPDLGNGDFTDL